MNLQGQTQSTAQNPDIPPAQTWLEALAGARHESKPFDHWLLERALPDDMIDAILDLPFPIPDSPVFNGRRETNNKLRVFFLQKQSAKVRNLRQAGRDFQISPGYFNN